MRKDSRRLLATRGKDTGISITALPREVANRHCVERLLNMFWRRKRERDLDDEIAAHLEMDTEERGGDRLAARKALGNTALVREETRAVWTWTWLEQLIQDLRVRAMCASSTRHS